MPDDDGIVQALRGILEEHSEKSRVAFKTESSNVTMRLQQERMKLLRWVVAPVIVAALSGGGSAVWSAAARPGAQEKATREITKSAGAVKHEVQAVEHRVGTMEKKINRLGERSIQQEVQMVDGIRFISDKIDEAHGEKAKNVPKPDSLQKAERRVDKIKLQKQTEELFGDIDK